MGNYQLDPATTAPASNRFDEQWAYLFLICAAVLLLYPVITGEFSFCIKQDNLHQAYPFMNKLASSLHKGYLPVWDANTYGGKNFSGELQTGIFYPLNIIWCLLWGSEKGIDVYYLDLLVTLHFLICLLGMYRVTRVFHLPPAAGIVSALIFTFTSAVAARAGGQTCIFFGLTLLPWSIYFIGKYYQERRRKRFLFFAGLIAGLEILAGHMQPFFHTVLIGGMIICFYEYSTRKGPRTFFLPILINISLIILFAFIISLPQLYYAREYLSQCYRSMGGGITIASNQKVPLPIYSHWHTISLSNLGNLLGQTYSQPDDDNLIYMGILPLALAITYIRNYKSLEINKEHTGLTRLLLIILVIGILSVLGYLTFFYLILYEIPFVSVVRQLGRYIILISFSASLLAGLAAANIAGLKKRLFREPSILSLLVLSAFSLNTVYWMFFQSKDVPFQVSLPFLLTSLFCLFLLFVKRAGNVSLLIIAVVLVDLFLNRASYLTTNTPFYPAYYYSKNRIFDSLEASYGKYRVTFDMEDYSLVRRNLGDVYNIQTKLGYGATYNKAYYDFVNVDESLNSKVNDLLNVRYVITDKKLDSNFIFKDTTQGLALYERKNYYPRCYWKRQLGEHGNEIEMENKGKIRLLAYTDLYQKVAVECIVPDTLIFSENYYPGWKCYDNGKEVTISPASIPGYPPLFRSITLDKGQHIIEFKYNNVFYFF